MDKEEVVRIYNGILLSHKKERHLVICSNMDGAGEYGAEWNQSDRERQMPYEFTYMLNPKNKISKTDTNSQMQRLF